jgi:hypothetical protein
MKYLIFLLFTATLLSCASNESGETAIGTDNIQIRYDSADPAGQALAGILQGYLEMKPFFPALQDTQQVHLLANQLMKWADSLSQLAEGFPVPISDSVQLLSIGISDELKGLVAETDPKGIALSFQLTGLQLYDLLRVLHFDGRRVYLFKSNVGGEEANWLDVVRESSHPFLTNQMKREAAVDSLVFR